ncbi:MAG TPA: multicopper oxidase family protein [Pyrinomonadaceae bacterium]|jgi:FtsP/CotA-like multicopper oxidase with cupredoxin domain|nr:multicopper oxidase family protein [Pyrinomonadaceae bacterium]
MPKKKAKNRQGVGKKTEGTISRRNVLKIGAAAGAATVLAPNIITTRKALAFADPVPPPLVQCTAAVRSPVHTPFVDDLPVPFPAIDHPLNPQPTETANTGAGEWPRVAHQRWAQFTPAHVTTELEARPGLHTFHSNFGPSYVWGFNGVYPGPTVLNRYGKPTIVRFRNSTPPNGDNTFGHPEITIHLHNGHHGSESDGFAGDFFPSGRWKDNLYPNCYAGLDTFGGNGDPREKMGTFWYHDHRAEKTLNNNVMGLNGMFIVYDPTDPGHEHPSAGSLQLPGYYGVTDFPLILTEKRFCALDAQGRNELVNAAGGDKWIVNGAIQPKLKVRNRKYRFRILSTGPTTAQWDLRLIGPTGAIETMTVVATDANFLEHPVPVDAGANAGNSNAIVGTTIITPGAVRVNVAERYDVIIDFGNYNAGDFLYLTDVRSQVVNDTGSGNTNPPGLPPGLNIGNVIMRFDVVNRETWFPQDTPAIPQTLCTFPPICEPDTTFQWNFTRDPAGSNPRFFRINNRVFDANLPQHCVLKGTCEEWLINNNTPNADGPTNWKHPVHIHFEEFRILKRFAIINGVFQEVPVTPLSQGRKDVTAVEPGEAALIRMNFRDYIGKYLIHCHNMGHEDAFMMVAWHIVPDAAAKAVCDSQIVQANKEFEAKLRGEEVS